MYAQVVVVYTQVCRCVYASTSLCIHKYVTRIRNDAVVYTQTGVVCTMCIHNSAACGVPQVVITRLMAEQDPAWEAKMDEEATRGKNLMDAMLHLRTPLGSLGVPN